MKHIRKLLLVAFPVMAALLNGVPRSVRMRFASPEGPFYVYESGFSMIPVGYANWGHMLAGIGACILAVLAIVYCLRPSDSLVKGLRIVSIVAAVILVLCMVMFGSETPYSWAIAVLLAAEVLLSQKG